MGTTADGMVRTKEAGMNEPDFNNEEDILGVDNQPEQEQPEEGREAEPQVERRDDDDRQDVSALKLERPIVRRLHEKGLRTIHDVLGFTKLGLLIKGLPVFDVNRIFKEMRVAGFPMKQDEKRAVADYLAKGKKPIKRLVTAPEENLRFEEDQEEDLPRKKPHWTQRPENKKKLKKHLKKMLAGRRRVAAQPVVGDRRTLGNMFNERYLAWLHELGITTIPELLKHSAKELNPSSQHRTRVVSKILKKYGLELRQELRVPVRYRVDGAVTSTRETKETYGKNDGQEFIGYVIGYAHADITARIHQFAESTGGKISAAELTYRLGRLLCGKKGGEVLGPEN